MKKKIFVFIIIFLVTGELMLRFDKKFKVLENKRVVKIKTEIEITPEFQLLQDITHVFSQNDFNVMVLGDSYIFGGGIDFKDNFSQNLKQLINNDNDYFENGYILDVSRPNANNLDHNLTYFEFVERYNPDVVIIGFNVNDVNGLLTKNPEKSDEFLNRKASSKKKISGIKKVYNVIFKSKLVHFTLHNLHNELKANGHIIKGSLADATLKSYWKKKNNWVQSKKLLTEIIEHANENGIQLIVYKFPEINLIEHPELFTKTNEAIEAFFSKFTSVIYIDGSKSFEGEKSEEFRLSKYDGHPNEKAHKKMATEVFEVIKSTNKSFKK